MATETYHEVVGGTPMTTKVTANVELESVENADELPRSPEGIRSALEEITIRWRELQARRRDLIRVGFALGLSITQIARSADTSWSVIQEIVKKHPDTD